jgi:hypothetical protein
MSTQSEIDLAAQFLAVTDKTTAAMRPMIIGPDYVARKYASDKTAVELGSYTGVSAQFAWPGIQSGEVVDLAFTKVHLEDAAQRYYSSSAGSQTGDPVFTNRVTGTVNWVDKAAYPRSGTVPCDVEIGDWVRVTGVGGSVVGTILELMGTPINPTTGASTASAANKATQAGNGNGAITLTVGSGTAVASVTGLNNAANYNGGPVGLVADTYVIECLDATTGTGNAGTWTGVRLKVYSVSGKDGTSSVPYTVTPVPATPVAIGSLGARATFSHGASGNDWVVGTKYQLVVQQAYAAPVTTSAGTFTGPSDTTYVVTVSRGGWFGVSAPPSGQVRAQITVATTTGIDNTFSAQDVTAGSAIVIGQYGVTIAFTATTNNALIAGDSWTVAVTAGTAYNSSVGGAITTLVLDHDLGVLATKSNLTVELAILGNVDIEKNRVGHAPTLNWTPSAASLTLNDSIFTLNDRTGSTELPVVSSTAYCTYRALRTTYANDPQLVATVDDLSTLGMPSDDPDNTLSYAVRRALSVGGVAGVRFCAVASDDLAGYNATQNFLLERTDFYKIVPLTYDTSIISSFVTFMGTRNAEQRWTSLMIGQPLVTTRVVVAPNTNCTVADDPLASGTQYTLVNDPSGTFQTAGVAAGDKLRIEYVADGFGGTSYSEYTIASVESNQVLRLTSGTAVPHPTPIKYEIWHPLSLDEQAADFDARAAAYANERVCVVFPPEPGRAGVRVPSYFLAAGLAGRRGAAPPHQSLRNLHLTDWAECDQATVTFAGKLSALQHCYVVNTLYTGEVVVRQANTTNIDSIDTREECIVNNLDSIQLFYVNLVNSFKGSANIVPATLTKLNGVVNNGTNFLRTNTVVESLGAQILAAQVVSVSQNEVNRDQVDVSLQLTLPAPMNAIIFTITVSV